MVVKWDLHAQDPFTSNSVRFLIRNVKNEIKGKEVAKMNGDEKKLTASFLWIAIVSSFGSAQYGYNLWVVYSPSVLVRDFYHLDTEGVEVTNEDPQNMLLMLAFSMSMFPIGAIAGALLLGPMVDKFGRKGALVLNSFFSVIACLFMVGANVAHSFGFIMLSRFLIGINMGVYSSAVPLYLAEISPVNSRGSVGMVPHIFLVLGVMMAQILAFREIMGNNEGWPILMSLSGILALFQSVLMAAFPESPRYLLIAKKDEEQARQALKQLRFNQDVEDEIEEMRQEDVSEVEDEDMNALKLLCYQELRWQVLSIIVLMAGQQLSGVNSVYYYTERVYLSTKIGSENVRYISVSSSIFILISMGLATTIVDSKGRKILLLVGFAVCGILCAVLTVTIELEEKATWIPYINSILLNLFLVVHASGPTTLPNLLIAELFLQSSRSSAYVVGGFVHWIIHFFTVILYLQIQQYVKSYSFLACVPICFATVFYIYKKIPETKGKTFLDIRKLVPAYEAEKAVLEMRPDQEQKLEQEERGEPV